jgi:hypothetical protein
MTPHEECFEEHVAAPPFQEGVDRGHWAIVRKEWPIVWIRISVAPRSNSPGELCLRFDLNNYMAVAPTATLWDLERNARLNAAIWPKGDGDVREAFKPKWKDGATGLYAPWDREALAAHPEWRESHKGRAWVPNDQTVVHYLRFTRELLISDNYHGC